jgi:hypothetical protein
MRKDAAVDVALQQAQDRPMSLWKTLARAFAAAPIADAVALAEFLETRASYLVQKSTAEYCQARAGLGYSALLGEASYQAALERGKWLGYPAAFSMVAESTAGALRAVAPAPSVERLMVKSAERVFERFPLPPGAVGDFWDVAKSSLAADLARAALGPPKPAHAIAALRAHEIFDALPLHPRLRVHDFEMFRNTLRFHLTEIGAEFEERADLGALAAAASAA